MAKDYLDDSNIIVDSKYIDATGIIPDIDPEARGEYAENPIRPNAENLAVATEKVYDTVTPENEGFWSSMGNSVVDSVTGRDRITDDIKDLPELVNSPEFGDFSNLADPRTLKSLAGTLVTADEKDLISIYKKQWGDDISFRRDKMGNVIARLPSGEYALNQPGLSQTDVGRGIAEGVAFSAGALGTVFGGKKILKSGVKRGLLKEVADPSNLRKAGTIAGSAVALGASDAVVESGLEGIDTALGGTFSGQDVLESSLFGAGGKLLEVPFDMLGRKVSDIYGSMMKKIRAPKTPDILGNYADPTDQQLNVSKVLNDAMERDNLTAEDVISGRVIDPDSTQIPLAPVREGGINYPETLVADQGTGFQRLLRSSVNEDAGVSGKAKRILDARSDGQAARISKALSEDNSNSLNKAIDAEMDKLRKDLERMDTELGNMYKDGNGGIDEILASRKNSILRAIDGVGKKSEVAMLDPNISGMEFKMHQNTVSNLYNLKNAPSSGSLTDELDSLDRYYKPIVTDMYKKADAEFVSSPWTDALLNGKLSRDGRIINPVDVGPVQPSSKNTVSKISKKIQESMDNKAIIGDSTSPFARYDATRRVLSDMIGTARRAGKPEKVRELLKIKKRMDSEIDINNPMYARARATFSSKAEIKEAGELGQDFAKMNPRELDEAIAGYGDSERRMFRIAARENLFDTIDKTNISADAVKKIFGKNGDARKLRKLFNTDAEFKTFQETMAREADYISTRRMAQGNSTTVEQALDLKNVKADVRAAADLFTPYGIYRVIGNIAGKTAGDVQEKQTKEVLKDIGTVLLARGVEKGQIRRILEMAPAEQKRALKRAARRPISDKWKKYARDTGLGQVGRSGFLSEDAPLYEELPQE